MPKAYTYRINNFHRCNVAETERLADFHHHFGGNGRPHALCKPESRGIGDANVVLAITVMEWASPN
jgi:hypothetical protein